MLDWLRRFVESAAGLVPSPVADLVQWSVQAIGGLLGTVTFNVADAWHNLTIMFDAVRAAHDLFGTSVLGQLEKLITYYIPHFAITAWWWVTHPEQLARVLLWYLVHEMERQAWTIGKYLGEFVLAILAHNSRRVAILLEDIITAIL